MPCVILLAGATSVSAQCQPAVQRLLGDRRFDEAKTQMVAAVGRVPEDDAAHECLGRVNLALDRARDAVANFERAIRINDKVATHHLWLGNALGELADSTSKIKLPFLARRIKGEFERTVELDPKSVGGREGLVAFYSQAPAVMGGSMDKARDQVAEIMKLNPMRGHFKAADLYAREKKSADVERELIAAEQSAPDSSLAGITLGSYYQNNQRWADAFAVYDRMLKRFPNEAMVHFYIGRTAALSGDQLERGERELKSFLAAPPADLARPTLAGAHHRLGMIYEKQGKRDLARAEYQQAVSIDSRNEAAKKSLAALK